MFIKKNFIIIFCLFVLGCGAKIRNGGYSLRPYQVDELKNAKNKEQAIKIAGSPSAKIEQFNKNTKNEIWLYSSYKSEQTAVLDPVYKNYDIVLLSFDESGNTIKADVKELSQDKFIKYSDAKTEFPGKIRLGLISELFGHIGKFSTLSSSDIGR